MDVFTTFSELHCEVLDFFIFILHASGLRLPPRFNKVNAHPAEDWCLNHQL